MARIRSIKPDFFTSGQIMDCSVPARLLFIGMWCFADDAGRINANPRQLKAQIYPSDPYSPEDIDAMVTELAAHWLVLPYTVEGRVFLWITGWKHQRIDKARAPKHPPVPPEVLATFYEQSSTGRRQVVDGSKKAPGMVDDQSRIDRIGSDIDRKGSDRIGSDIPEGKNLPAADAAVDSVQKGKGKANGLHATVAAMEAPLARTVLFNTGSEELARMTGRSALACRTLIGKWLKGMGDERAPELLAIINKAKAKGLVEPQAWIEKAVQIASGSREIDIERVVALVEEQQKAAQGARK